jgi:hypothetical protein
MDFKLLEPRNLFVIHERLMQSPLDIPIPGDLPISPQLNKLVRVVYQVTAEALNITFMGTPLGRQPGWYEYVLEGILPGRQIRSTPGPVNSLTLVFAGFYNLANLPFLPGSPSVVIRRPETLFLGKWYRTMGSDPIPLVQLYGNPMINFSSAGGTGVLEALAFYNGDRGELRDVGAAHQAVLLQQLRSNPLLTGVTF